MLYKIVIILQEKHTRVNNSSSWIEIKDVCVNVRLFEKHMYQSVN